MPYSRRRHVRKANLAWVTIGTHGSELQTTAKDRQALEVFAAQSRDDAAFDHVRSAWLNGLGSQLDQTFVARLPVTILAMHYCHWGIIDWSSNIPNPPLLAMIKHGFGDIPARIGDTGVRGLDDPGADAPYVACPVAKLASESDDRFLLQWEITSQNKRRLEPGDGIFIGLSTGLGTPEVASSFRGTGRMLVKVD